MTTSNSDPKRELLRHAVATLAYRGNKAVRNAPAGFAEFRGCASSRSAGQILAHLAVAVGRRGSSTRRRSQSNIASSGACQPIQCVQRRGRRIVAARQ